ncbi:MAG: FHA domain-containing protein, partial [Myxococcales bacterium]|nr:FHA domain-containing protein [Myxococcales bacterium]
MSDVSQTLLHPAARRPGLRAERPFVLVVGATRHGPFERAASVGAAPSNQVVLPDPTVSRFHFEITRGALGLRVVDVGSTNGTFVNGVRVFDAVLEDGAELRAGDTRLRVEVEPVPRYVQDDAPASFGGLIGESPAMRRLLELLVRLAAVDTPVLVQGETGSGKELV